MARPKPVNRIGTRIDCKCYNKCLGFVVKQDWDSFSCEECPNKNDPGYRVKQEPLKTSNDRIIEHRVLCKMPDE